MTVVELAFWFRGVNNFFLFYIYGQKKLKLNFFFVNITNEIDK
jgi:hypothetical protein